MPTKRVDGILREIIVHRAPARNALWSGGESRVVKLLTDRGQHVGTIHEVVLASGTVAHSHPKDYTRRDCSRVRASGEML